jgi:hypothetical protein
MDWLAELEEAEDHAVLIDVVGDVADLSDVEKTVIHHRFGLDRTDETPPLTLEQVGQIIGVTKERVRQIETSAFDHLTRLIADLGSDHLLQFTDTRVHHLLRRVGYKPYVTKDRDGRRVRREPVPDGARRRR